MQKAAQATLLLLIVGITVVGGGPFLIWMVLPAGIRSWLTEGDGLAETFAVIAVCSIGMGALAMPAFKAWEFLARRIYGRENIDAQVAEWSKRR